MPRGEECLCEFSVTARERGQYRAELVGHGPDLQVETDGMMDMTVPRVCVGLVVGALLTRLPDCPTARLPGCPTARLPGCKVAGGITTKAETTGS